MRNLQ